MYYTSTSGSCYINHSEVNVGQLNNRTSERIPAIYPPDVIASAVGTLHCSVMALMNVVVNQLGYITVSPSKYFWQDNNNQTLLTRLELINKYLYKSLC